MRKFLYLSGLLIMGLVFNGCTKDSDIFTPDPGQIMGPDDTWYAAITSAMPVNNLKSSLVFSTDKDSFDIVSTDHTIVFASGLECTFPGNAFVDNSGAAVTAGKVIVESYLLKKKGDLIRMAKPTVSNGQMLVSGGSIFIQAKKDGANLKLGADKKIQLHYGYNYVTSKMKLFNPDDITPETQQFNWLPCSDTLNGNNKVVPYSEGYDIYTNRLKWLNCNYFYSINSDDSVKISLTLPTNFTNANTISYVVVNDENSVLGMQGDVASKKFISGAVPHGKTVKVISITKEGNLYYLGQNSFVANRQSAGRYQNVNINPTKISLEAIKDFLNNL